MRDAEKNVLRLLRKCVDLNELMEVRELHAIEIEDSSNLLEVFDDLVDILSTVSIRRSL